MSARRCAVALALLGVVVAGCTDSTSSTPEPIHAPPPGSRVVVVMHPDGPASPVLLYPADCFDPERREKWSAPECQGAETRRASY